MVSISLLSQNMTDMNCLKKQKCICLRLYAGQDIDKTQITEDMVFAGETALSEKTMLNPSRVVTYAISEKDYDKTLLTDELIDPDEQVRLELWAYNPKQFSEDNSADDISVVLSFTDTNDERIEEAVDELQERRLQG